MSTLSPPVDVLWTGGWDSTYRVLDLALIQGRPVRPHYLVDPARASTAAEIGAIRKIKERAERRGARIGRLRVTAIFDVPEDAEVTAAHRRLRTQGHLGGQYDWLSRYARSLTASEVPDAGEAAPALELSVHRDDKAEAFLSRHVVREGSGTWALAPEAPCDLQAVFGLLRFPILDLTKEDMDDAANGAGFADLLGLTWFCFDPKGDRPCGVCLPCRYTNEEAMGRRLPPSAHVRRRAHDLLDAANRAVGPVGPVVGRALRRVGLRS